MLEPDGFPAVANIGLTRIWPLIPTQPPVSHGSLGQKYARSLPPMGIEKNPFSEETPATTAAAPGLLPSPAVEDKVVEREQVV